MENTVHLSEMNADEALTALKEKKNQITGEEIENFYNAGLQLLNKFSKTNQIAAAKKLLFHLECCEKELKLIDKGINTFIYADDVKFYIEKIATNDVKLIDIENYEREIPDSVVDVIEETSDLFTDYWILYTDYAYDERAKASQEENVERARISKDPILFGVMKDNKNRTISERYYFLADWIDEYCDLTLEKFLDEMRSNGKNDVEHKISTPLSIDELREQFNAIELEHGKFVIKEEKRKKKTFMDKVRTVLRGK